MKDVPEWIQELVNRAANVLIGQEALGPIGCHFREGSEHEPWELTVFVSSMEVLGGQMDGVHFPARMFVDLQELFRLFDSVTNFYWQTAPAAADDELGAHISLEGEYMEHWVWLRILSKAPKRFPAGRSLDAFTLQLRDRW